MVQNVRAKFKVDALEHTQSGTDTNGNKIIVTTVKMTPVYPKAEGDKPEDQHENRTFWKYTPAGELRLSTINAKAAEYFEIGSEYYLDFTKA